MDRVHMWSMDSVEKGGPCFVLTCFKVLVFEVLIFEVLIFEVFES